MRIISLILLFSLFSCGFQQIVIPNLDIAAHRKLRKDLDLNRAQQKRLNFDIDKLLNDASAIIKVHGLPLIEKINTDSLPRMKTRELQEQIAILYFHLSEKFTQMVSVYLAELNPKQLAHYSEVQQDQNNDIKKRIKKYNPKLIIERIEFFTGRLNDSQKKIITSFKDYLIARNKERLLRREHLALKLDEALKIVSKEKRTLAVTKVFANYNKLTLDYFKSNQTRKSYSMIQDVIKSLDDKQKKHLAKKIQTAKEWTRYLIQYKY